MKTKETLIIKNFGPIVDAKIDIKPFMVFIGESGSGKSVILKLLSLFRWIYKKIALKDLSKNINVKKELYRFRIERMLKESGLDDFCVKGSKAEYILDDFCVSISCNGKVKLSISPNTHSKISLEKISFITDDRFAIPMLVNNQIRGTLPYHLEKTFEDFKDSFEHLQTNKKVQLKTFDIVLSNEKYDIQNRFFVNQKDSKTQLHNASSGMKSTSVIEIISYYFATDREYMQNKYANFIISLFTISQTKDMNSFLEKIKNVQFDKQRFSLFIEEPELSLFPNAQKKLVEYLVNLCFYLDTKKSIQIAFSTHSPYMLSALNCLLLAHQVGSKNADMKANVEKIVSSKFWLDINKFNAFVVENGKVNSIIDKEDSLILADKIDGVSEELDEIFDNLLELK